MNDELRLLLADVFQVPPDCLDDETSPQTMPAWDSLATVNLVTALEQHFECTFSLEELVQLGSVGAIRRLLLEKGIAK